MAKAPKEQPIIDIPGIETAKIIELRTRNRGEDLSFSLFVDSQLVKLGGNEWNDRSWFGLVIRELDRRKVWFYTMDRLGERMIYKRRDEK